MKWQSKNHSKSVVHIFNKFIAFWVLLCILISDIQIWKRYVLTTVVAMVSMIAGYVMLAANQNAPPVVISVARASEILLALVVDKILFGEEDTKGEFHNYNTKLILQYILFEQF